MNEIPVVWNKNSGPPAVWNGKGGKKLPETWNGGAKLPEKWGAPPDTPDVWKSSAAGNGLPSAWVPKGGAPDGWGKGGALSADWGKNGSAAPFRAGGSASVGAFNGSELAGAARAGAGRLAGAAKKFGGAAKNAAGNAAAYARSDEFKAKADSAKNRARSLAGGAGSALSGLKDKAGAAVNERKAAKLNAALSCASLEEEAYKPGADTAPADELSGGVIEELANEPEYENAARDEFDEYEYEPNSAENGAYSDISEREEYGERADYSPYRQGVPAQTGYYGESSANYQRKSSKAVPVLLAIIGVLLAGSGVLGGMLIMKNKNDKTESSAPSAAENAGAAEALSQASDAAPEEGDLPTESDLPTEDDGSKVSINENALPKALKQFPASDILKYPQYMDLLYDNLEGSKYKGVYDVGEVNFAMCDLNSDSQPELIIKAGNLDIYAIHNGNAVNLTPFWGGNLNKGTFVYDTGYVSLTSISGNGQGGYTFYRYNGGEELEVVDAVSFDLSVSSDEYEYEGRTISQEECDAIAARYGNSVDLSGAPVSDYIDTVALAADEYTDRSDLIALGKVVTQSDPLNMRKTPSDSGEIIERIPKDAYVGIISTTGNWYYVKYYQDMESPIYYGYVSKDYILVTENLNGGDLKEESYVVNGVTVYACNKYGRINARGGRLPSITFDYIAGGSISYVRDSLGNGWHVEAVRYAESLGITWYEIYDADDGDYYGWIDGAFIDFD